MRKFKHIMYLVSLAILFLFIVNIKAEPEPITLKISDWMVTQSKFVNKEIELFQKANPNIKITRNIITSNRYKESFMYNMRSGNVPDIFQAMTSDFIPWSQSGYFHSLNKWVTSDFSKVYPKGAFLPGINVYNKQIYSLPIDGPQYWCQLYVNTTVFKKAGLVDKKGNIIYPKTWKEIRQFAKIITQKGKGTTYGFGIQAKPEDMASGFFYEWARVAGGRGADQGQFLDVDLKVGKYNFTDPGFLRMFNLIFSMVKDKSLYPGYLSIEDEVLRAYFAEGKVGMLMGGTWNMPGWERTHPNFKEYEIIMIPPYDNAGYLAFTDTTLAKGFYYMASTTKYPEEAWKFISWFSQPEVGARWIEAKCGTSIFPEAMKLAHSITPQMKEYLEISSKYAKVHPNPLTRNPELAKVKMTIPLPDSTGIFWGILSGQIPEKNIPQTLKELEDRFNKTLIASFKEAQQQGLKVKLEDLKFSDWNPLENYETKVDY